MRTLNIFIASSYELTEQRIQIGDLIRRLSYCYSPYGVRLRMLCWEDFDPAYSGRCKQQEYDEQLISSCDIFIAMFRNRCGMFTQHEVQFALLQQKPTRIILFDPTEEHNDLDAFLSTIPVTPQHSKEAEISQNVSALIHDYLKQNNIVLSSKATPINTWRLYATIPDDMEDFRLPYSNMVRSIEQNLEDTYGIYFTLHPYRQPKYIPMTDYFHCLMKDQWSVQDESEVELAYNSLRQNHIPCKALLYQLKNHNGEDDNALTRMINSEYQGFSSTFDCLDTIKCHLLLWAMKQKNDVLALSLHVFTVEGNIIYCYNRPFFHLSSFPALRNIILKLQEKLDKIDSQIKKNLKQDGSFKNEHQARKLTNKRSHIAAQIEDTIIRWYNGFMMQHKVSAASANILTSESERLYNQYQITTKNIQQIVVQIQPNLHYSVSALCNEVLHWVELSRTCLRMEIIKPESHLVTLQYTIAIYDTYLNGHTADIKENDIYKEVAELADRYNLHSLFTEVIRVNFGNSFQHAMDFKSMELHYKTAYNNILSIPENTLQANKHKSYVITSLLRHYEAIDNKDAVLSLANEFIALIRQWQQTYPFDYDVDLARCYAIALAAAPKEYGVGILIVAEAERLYSRLHKRYSSHPESEDYYDAICYLSIVLSTYFIDRFPEGGMDYYNKGMMYVKESQNALKARYPYDPDYIERSLSQPLHNRAFLYSKVAEWDNAISNYKSALRKRRKLYEKETTKQNLYEIAQTLVNLGDAYRNTYKFDKSLACADEALAIYHEKKDEEQVLTMLYYEAYQLKATILLDKAAASGLISIKALRMLAECLKWSRDNSQNDYKDRFEGVSGVILEHYSNVIDIKNILQ